MVDYSIAYGYDLNGYFTEVVKCQLDPVATRYYGEERYLLPAQATYKAPLPDKEGYKVKFVDSDWVYEEIPTPPEPPAPTPEEIIQAEIDELKSQLSATDYKIIKCSEYSLNGQELPYNIAQLHAERQALRDRINELENLLIQSVAE